MDSRRGLSGERGLGIISLRAPGIEAQFERKSPTLDRNPLLLDGRRVHEHDRHDFHLRIRESLIDTRFDTVS